MKIIGYICLIILTASCTNIDKKQKMSINNLDQKLVSKLEVIKNDLKKNEKTSLKNSLELSFLKNYGVNELLKNDLSRINFNYTMPQVEQNSAANIIALRYREDILYFDAEYKYLNNDWKITELKEKK